MTEVWRGPINTPDSSANIQDFQLWTHASSPPSPFPLNAKLSFLSHVHVPSIPLYLAIGPSLEVYTDSGTTVEWLTQSLIGHDVCGGDAECEAETWWLHPSRQSERGTLLKVDVAKGEYNPLIHATELLVYAAAKYRRDLPPVPVSCPPGPAQSPTEIHDVDQPGLQVYALPLSSRIIQDIEEAGKIDSPKLEDNLCVREARFFPSGLNHSPQNQAVPQKRQKLSDLFEDATQQRRKLKGRGGESISKAMADIDRLPPRTGLSLEAQSERIEIPPVQRKTTARSTLSRTPTSPSVAGSENARPVSRSGHLANGKRSSLHRVESAISPRDSPTISDVDNTYSQQNKAALVRMVMASMRLHGLQQKKISSKDQETSQHPITSQSHTEDEYKLVYHQTLKAVMFTFRRQIDDQVIAQEIMRDTVDKFLDIFCTDPLATNGLNDVSLQPFGGTGNPEPIEVFDKPSTGGIPELSANSWTNPSITKQQSKSSRSF